MSQTSLFDGPTINPSEAPEGYYAAPKSYGGYNICRDCDWRPACCDPATDLTRREHRCMDYPLYARDGRVVQREDGCSVVFKKLQA